MSRRIVRNAGNEDFVVVLNPTGDDGYFLGKYIRFTADARTRTVYAWSFSAGHHGDVSIGLKLKDSYACPDVFRGAAFLKNGMYRFSGSDFLSSFCKNPGKEDRRFLRRLFKKDWSWVDPYVRLSGAISRLKEKFKLRMSISPCLKSYPSIY